MVRPLHGATAPVVLVLCLGFLGHRAYANRSSHKAAFLQPHNAARAEVGVAKLSWNATLAAYARRYAGRRARDCKLVHSRGPYGENISWGSAGCRWAAGDAVASSWVKEKTNYDCESNRCARRRKCGHYTQVVWAKDDEGRLRRGGVRRRRRDVHQSSSAATTRQEMSMGRPRIQAVAVIKSRPCSNRTCLCYE
ncbi:unnamed protein product [Urochloa humidicola]